MYCPVSDNNGVVKCENQTKKGMKPGDLAEEDSWCYSGKRDPEGYCIGKLQEEPCGIDLECDIGLYCNKTSKKCLPASNEGESCAKGELCQSYLMCYEGKCTKFGQLENGQKISISGNGRLCKSKYMDPQTRTCEKGPVLVSAQYLNDTRAMCLYSYKGRTITGFPMCGFSLNGSLICPKQEGDLEKDWQNLVNFTTYKPPCHVVHDYGFCGKARSVGCDVYVRGSYGFYLSDSITNTLLLQVPVCIKNWMYKDYWYPTCGKTSFSSYLGLNMIGIVVLSLLIL